MKISLLLLSFFGRYLTQALTHGWERTEGFKKIKIAMRREYNKISLPPVLSSINRDLAISEQSHSPNSVPSLNWIRDKTEKNVTTKTGQNWPMTKSQQGFGPCWGHLHILRGKTVSCHCISESASLYVWFGSLFSFTITRSYWTKKKKKTTSPRSWSFVWTIPVSSVTW